MNDTGNLICLLLSSSALITFGFFSAFLTKKFNDFVELTAKRMLKKKVKLSPLNKLEISEELKMLKIFGVLMFSFGILFISIFAIYVAVVVFSVRV